MTKSKKKQSVLRSVKDELTIIQQRIDIYNNVVDQILKKVGKRYGRINITVDEPSLLNEMAENDDRFIDLLTLMVSLQEKMSHEGQRKYRLIYSRFNRMVDRTASMMTKKPTSYTLNFCLRRGMTQNTIIIKKLISQLDVMIAREETQIVRKHVM